MSTEPARADAEWLSLREPADAAARSRELVEQLRSGWVPGSGATIHDLGCGTGSMARWLAGELAGPQHWICYDRDVELLALVAAEPPGEASDGAPVTLETRRRDITRLNPDELAGASLITASALLDMMTAEELRRLVTTSAGAGCPVLITLSVTGVVDLRPADTLDERFAGAFNAHQRRDTGGGRLLGPDAVGAAVDAFTRLGCDVLTSESAWQLGPGQSALVTQWFTGWVAAACEQRPELGEVAVSYVRRRLDEAVTDRLSVTVHHRDLLVRTNPRRRS